MPDSYKELIKSNPDETEIRSFIASYIIPSYNIASYNVIRQAGHARGGYTTARGPFRKIYPVLEPKTGP